jgi:carboxyl-terminal processing protease
MVRISHALWIGSTAVFLVGLIAFVGGWHTGHAMGNVSLQAFVTTPFSDKPTTASATNDGDSFAVFWEVWDIVRAEFYHSEPLDEQQMMYGAVRGMLQTLGDDYTIFQEPETAERSRESLQGSFEGIGVYMRIDTGQMLITRPIDGSPAMEAGLRTGDVIVAVDGQDIAATVAELPEADAVNAVSRLIRGPTGSTVTLTIVRPPDEAPFDVEIVRAQVPLVSVYAEMLPGNVAYIQITEFKATTTRELDDALRELLPQEPVGVILDVRNNPGGFLRTSQEVLGRFYEGVALYERMSDGSVEELNTVAAPDDVRIFDLPLVVLVNEHSASAAEIVAGALRDERPNTVLLGANTFGKGSVQNIHRLSDGSSVRVTIARWFTPDQHEIHEIGIAPDYALAASQEPQYSVPCIGHAQPPVGMDTCSDAQIIGGIELLTTEEPPVAPLEAAPAEVPTQTAEQ